MITTEILFRKYFYCERSLGPQRSVCVCEGGGGGERKEGVPPSVPRPLHNSLPAAPPAAADRLLSLRILVDWENVPFYRGWFFWWVPPTGGVCVGFAFLHLFGHLGGAGAQLPGVPDVSHRKGTRAKTLA